MFHKYPTIAPNGKIVPDDINKKAASIELYLPDSIIKTGGNYYPIEWGIEKTNTEIKIMLKKHYIKE